MYRDYIFSTDYNEATDYREILGSKLWVIQRNQKDIMEIVFKFMIDDEAS